MSVKSYIALSYIVFFSWDMACVNVSYIILTYIVCVVWTHNDLILLRSSLF